MMNKYQIMQKIRELEKEINIYRNILENDPEGPLLLGRPIGSTKYPPEKITFLEECEKRGLTDREIITEYNKKFGTNLAHNSRALYNVMQRQGIRKTGWRWGK